MPETTNPPQPGDRVLYWTEHETMASGVLAEREISPLTGDPRYRVVDFHQEIKDEEAGLWMGFMDVLKFGV